MSTTRRAAAILRGVPICKAMRVFVLARAPAQSGARSLQAPAGGSRAHRGAGAARHRAAAGAAEGSRPAWRPTSARCSAICGSSKSIVRSRPKRSGSSPPTPRRFPTSSRRTGSGCTTSSSRKPRAVRSCAPASWTSTRWDRAATCDCCSPPPTSDRSDRPRAILSALAKLDADRVATRQRTLAELKRTRAALEQRGRRLATLTAEAAARAERRSTARPSRAARSSATSTPGAI